MGVLVFTTIATEKNRVINGLFNNSTIQHDGINGTPKITRDAMPRAPKV
jgi:hypothetical protein